MVENLYTLSHKFFSSEPILVGAPGRVGELLFLGKKEFETHESLKSITM